MEALFLISVGLMTWWLGYVARAAYGSKSRDPESAWPLWAGRLWAYLASSCFFLSGLKKLTSDLRANAPEEAGSISAAAIAVAVVVQILVGRMYLLKTRQQGWRSSPRRERTILTQMRTLGLDNEPTEPPGETRGDKRQVLGIVSDVSQPAQVEERSRPAQGQPPERM